jgi:type III secretory pathway component EscS
VTPALPWLQHFSAALLLGLQAALPVVVLVAGAGLLASFVQSMIGYGDVAVGLGFRLLAAAVGLAVFGSWMAGLVLAYWQWLWGHIPMLVGGSP